MSKTDYSDWPKRGDTREQPWSNLDSGVTPRAGLPLLVSGGSLGVGPEAQALFTALAELGYETPISRGANPFGVLGSEEMSAVEQFRRDYGVTESPEPFGGDNATGRAVAASHIGGYTGEAILRAAAAKGAPAETPEAELVVLRERVQELERKQSTGGKTATEHGSKLSALERRLAKLENRNGKTGQAKKPAAATS